MMRLWGWPRSVTMGDWATVTCGLTIVPCCCGETQKQKYKLLHFIYHLPAHHWIQILNRHITRTVLFAWGRLMTVVLFPVELVATVVAVETGGRSTTAVRALEAVAAAWVLGCGSRLCWMKASESGVNWRSAGRLLCRRTEDRVNKQWFNDVYFNPHRIHLQRNSSSR